jgi:hypothetical protein
MLASFTSVATRNLPPPLSPQFWAALRTLSRPAEGLLEELAQTVRFFTLQSDPFSAQQVFTVLYQLFEPLATRMCRECAYDATLAEELGQSVWLKIYRDLTNPDPGFNTIYLNDFVLKFRWDVKSLARQQANEEGYRRTQRRAAARDRLSLDAPLPLSATPENNETPNFGSLLEDMMQRRAFEIIGKQEELRSNLSDRELEIIRLKLNGAANYKIAGQLKTAEKTLKRDLETLELKLRNILLS